MSQNTRVPFDDPGNVSPMLPDGFTYEKYSDEDIVLGLERLVNEFGAENVWMVVADKLVHSGILSGTTPTDLAARVQALVEIVKSHNADQQT
ncbi:hypothetical protein HA052_04315 [Chromobacterium haemolyticum]|uniref:Uncharacterized protein n=1 Tax=Chromobacterium fluminis TaxID=3044269 RepID=A0ABX0KY25_9NEIS|nr:hypothetical protein [Chromobacterium haemolyticum]NHR04414.1 hypothetical protein [Chromobacterium haemolyticum]